MGPRSVGTGQPGGSTGPQVQADGFRTPGEIAAAVRACAACPLSRTRKNAVPGEGCGSQGIVFVGEAPGAKEDAQGRPFVGQAGKILNGLLKKNGMLREEVFITNVVKCRPPKNRPPKPAEVAACRPYIQRQLELLEPAVVCPMGNSATRALLDPEANITDMHGRTVEKDGLRFMPLYHPAAILYNRKLMKETEKDFEELVRLAEG
jgi:uracil-DNA glycosylase family 4